MNAESRLHVVWHRCVVDDRDHAVTDEEFTAGRFQGQGRFVAVCGHVTYPGSMLDSPGPPCRRCNAYLEALASLRSAEQRFGVEPRKPGFWRRLLRHIKSPAVPRSCPPHGTDSPARDGRTQAPAGVGSDPSAPIPAGRHRMREPAR